MKPILVTMGEPAGIGPDICLALADCNIPVVVMGDKDVLESRAKQLNTAIRCVAYQMNEPVVVRKGQLTVLSLDFFPNPTAEGNGFVDSLFESLCTDMDTPVLRAESPCTSLSSMALERSLLPAMPPVVPGQLNQAHASSVIQMLTEACERVLMKEFSALVTGPVHKGILNEAGFVFSGHTEFFKAQCRAHQVVMLLASPLMKVALVTTHLPLASVPKAVTKAHLQSVITTLNTALQRDFGLTQPKIAVAGLNPHAGESGFLGREEIDVITPVIAAFQREGMHIDGPLSADTLFSEEHCAYYDVFLSMYHDQGLPVIKYADFKRAINITLGLPIIRTSVDHGTALSLAGTGKADPSSLLEAVKAAYEMAGHREQHGE